MGKQCNGQCKRMVNEYYILKDGGIMCYDCWRRALDQNQRYLQEFEQADRRYFEIQEQIKQLHDEQSHNKSLDYDGFLTMTKDPVKEEQITQMLGKLYNEQESLRRIRSSGYDIKRIVAQFVNAQHVKEP